MTTDKTALDALRFTKKPVTIEAWQFTTDVAWNYWLNKKLPPFGCNSISGNYHPKHKTIDDAYFSIETLEGNMKVSLGDWIIKGVKGEFYPCKPDIFEMTYTRPQPSGDAPNLITRREIDGQEMVCIAPWFYEQLCETSWPEWQPIETAPRDGTRVLLLMVGGKQCVARTEHNPFRGSQWVIYGELGKPGCWVLASDDDTQPTHWMPLPAAPKKEGV